VSLRNLAHIRPYLTPLIYAYYLYRAHMAWLKLDELKSYGDTQ
jgi:hypothetical protein